jgi:hypothetical protein
VQRRPQGFVSFSRIFFACHVCRDDAATICGHILLILQFVKQTDKFVRGLGFPFLFTILQESRKPTVIFYEA